MEYLIGALSLLLAVLAFLIFSERRRNRRLATLTEGDVSLMQKPARSIMVFGYTPSDNGHAKKNAPH